VPIRRVINGGGIPQKNPVLNQVYANVLGKPVLVPEGDVTSLGSAIFAFLAAGTFRIRSKKRRRRSARAIAPSPQPEAPAIYAELYPLYRSCIFRLADNRSKSAPFCPNCAASRRGAWRDPCWKRCELKCWKPIWNWCAGAW
jgi:L-ribulokinase